MPDPDGDRTPILPLLVASVRRQDRP